MEGGCRHDACQASVELAIQPAARCAREGQQSRSNDSYTYDRFGNHLGQRSKKALVRTILHANHASHMAKLGLFLNSTNALAMEFDAATSRQVVCGPVLC